MAAVLIACIGCNRDDGDKLARIGGITAQCVEKSAPAQTPFNDFLPDTSRAARVRARLRTDKALADLPITVRDERDGIHLSGTMPHADQIDWAVRLARETVGVTDVVNELTVGP